VESFIAVVELSPEEMAFDIDLNRRGISVYVAD